MNARERIWAWIESNRDGAVVRGTTRQIAEEAGVGQDWCGAILLAWQEEGAVEVIAYATRRIVARPALNGFARSPLWPPEQQLLLVELWTAGLSLSQIAREMNMTRNAIAGKRQRMKLPGRPSPVQHRNGEAAE